MEQFQNSFLGSSRRVSDRLATLRLWGKWLHGGKISHVPEDRVKDFDLYQRRKANIKKAQHRYESNTSIFNLISFV